MIKALASTQFTGARGPIKLDADHDAIQNCYIQQVVKNGNDFTFKIVATYSNVGKEWDTTKDEMAKFPFGQLGGKWVGMTKDSLPK